MMMKTATTLGLLFVAAITSARAESPRMVTVQATVADTLSYLPYLSRLIPRGGDLFLGSSCSQTTATNLEWRRSFVEFELPVTPEQIVRATLHLTEVNGGWSSEPQPTDVHEVSLYPGDLVVDPSDYDVPTILVGTLETDPNDDPNPHVFEFDVTQAILQMAKPIVGVRIKLQIDPADPCVQGQGAGSFFGGLSFYPPMLELEVEKIKKQKDKD